MLKNNATATVKLPSAWLDVIEARAAGNGRTVPAEIRLLLKEVLGLEGTPLTQGRQRYPGERAAA